MHQHVEEEPVAESEDWTPVPRTRTYELVLERIEMQILNGGLRAGERLPAERDLAVLLSVSRPAVREALRILEAQGVVRAQVGTGPDSGTIIDRVPGDALARLLRLHVALGSFPVQDVMEVRVALERASAVLACRNASEAQRQRMAAALQAMEATGIDRETFNDHDTEFHIAMAEAGGNVLLYDATRAIRESVRAPVLAGLSALPTRGPRGWPLVRAGLRADHQAIYAAVLAGRGEEAADAVEAHVRDFSARLPDDP